MGDDKSFPAAFRAADQASLAGQRSTLMFVRWGLLLSLVAAFAGIFTWRVGRGDLDVMAGIGALAFLGALAFTLGNGNSTSQERWYRGRAVAESIKTMAWSYAVGGGEYGLSNADSEAQFLRQVDRVLKSMGKVELIPMTGVQITQEMTELREKPLAERREAYLNARITDQADWYSRRASEHKQSARRWLAVAVAANGLGLVGAIGRFLNFFDWDVLGFAAAIAGSATAWSQLRQHRTLAGSYALAAQELGIVGDRVRAPLNEPEWAEAVSDAEDAISKEHTMWLARHGYDSVKPDQ